MPLAMEVGLRPGDFVLDGDPAPSQKGGGARGRSPQFSAHVYCGQTAGCIKIPFSTEVGLGLCNILLVHGQVTIIFVVSLFVCLFVQSFSQPSLIRFRSN